MEKRTITLEDGRVIDCGVEEFDAMVKAIKEGTPREITLATVKVLQSSDDLMDDLVKNITEVFEKADAFDDS